MSLCIYLFFLLYIQKQKNYTKMYKSNLRIINFDIKQFSIVKYMKSLYNYKISNIFYKSSILNYYYLTTKSIV